jgi:hypothetical protein
MDTAPRFTLHLETWLTLVLRQKAIASGAGDQAAAGIGAADFATMISDYVLEMLGGDPRSCLSCCGIDDVTNDEIVEATGFDRDVLAATFVGAVLELAPWVGFEGMSLLMAHGVPEEDAVEFTHAVEIVSEKLGVRGQALIVELTGKGEPMVAAL